MRISRFFRWRRYVREVKRVAAVDYPVDEIEPPTPESVSSAIGMSRVAAERDEETWIVPTGNGGISFDWDDLSIECDRGGDVRVIIH